MQDNHQSKDKSCVQPDYCRSLNTDQKIIEKYIYLSPEKQNPNFPWTNNYTTENIIINSQQRNSLFRKDSSIKKPFGDYDESYISLSDTLSEFSYIKLDDDSNLRESTPEMSPVKN